MGSDILIQIKKEFLASEVDLVVKELKSITVDHVMAQSENNLRNTRMSILKLSQGRLDKVVEYTKCAKVDFRDVMYWVSLMGEEAD